ncbi:MAG TPA: SRPBCC domain-containing protein [Burkholderiales bacterium]|jgi:uncharacterized protein YndB with AHSA1/START domain/uncharacterized protein YciI
MNADRSASRSVADVDAGVILASVEIEAAPERVFAALTTPAQLLQWWGDGTQYHSTHWEMDLRPGGAWRAEGKSVKRDSYQVGGRVLEVEAPRKLVLTWKPDWFEGEETRVTYRLEAIEGGTRVTVRHEGFAGFAAACRDHTAGWERVLGWVARHVEAPVEPRYFVARLLPPRPSFALDMNEEERAMMGRHAAYLRERMDAGEVLLFGPVADPQGPWGLGILRARDENEARALTEQDPAILAGRGLRYELLPMLRAVLPQ